MYNTWVPGAKVNQAAVNPEFTQAFTPRNTVAVQAIPTNQNAWTPPVPTQVNFYATDSTPDGSGNPGQAIKNLSAIGANTASPPDGYAYSYAPRTDYPSGPKSEARQWRWPGDGVVQTSSQLNILWHELTEDPACSLPFGGLVIKNIIFDETYVERVTNPTAAPDAWTFGSPRFADLNIPKYTPPSGSGTQPVAVWGAAILKELTQTYIYGHTLMQESADCYTCTDPNNASSCTLDPNIHSPKSQAKDVVLARVAAGQSIRDPAQWQYWWDRSGGNNCPNIGEGCSGATSTPCWCREPPDVPSDLRVVATSAANVFSVDKITIGSNTRYVMVQGHPTLVPIAYVRVAGVESGSPTLTSFPPPSTTWSCAAEPCSYPVALRDYVWDSVQQKWVLGDKTSSGELSIEATIDWVAADNTNHGALLTGPASANNGIIRINHAQGHAQLSEISGVGGTNDLLIGYYASHIWSGNIPNTQYPTCAQSDSATCNATQGTHGGVLPLGSGDLWRPLPRRSVHAGHRASLLHGVRSVRVPRRDLPSPADLGRPAVHQGQSQRDAALVRAERLPSVSGDGAASKTWTEFSLSLGGRAGRWRPSRSARKHDHDLGGTRPKPPASPWRPRIS